MAGERFGFVCTQFTGFIQYLRDVIKLSHEFTIRKLKHQIISKGLGWCGGSGQMGWLSWLPLSHTPALAPLYFLIKPQPCIPDAGFNPNRPSSTITKPLSER